MSTKTETCCRCGKKPQCADEWHGDCGLMPSFAKAAGGAKTRAEELAASDTQAAPVYGKAIDELPNATEEWAFWEPLVCDESGRPVLERVKAELLDFSMVLAFYSKVLDHITGGACSKQNTLPSVVCALADDHYTAIAEDDAQEVAAELRRLAAVEVERDELRAKVEVAEAGYTAAVEAAKWQASTNSELNRLVEQRDRLAAEVDALRLAMNPSRWDQRLSDAWHLAIPDLHKAFAELKAAAIDAACKEQG